MKLTAKKAVPITRRPFRKQFIQKLIPNLANFREINFVPSGPYRWISTAKLKQVEDLVVDGVENLQPIQ